MQVLAQLLFLGFVDLLRVNNHVWQKVKDLSTPMSFHTSLLIWQLYYVTQNLILGQHPYNYIYSYHSNWPSPEKV